MVENLMFNLNHDQIVERVDARIKTVFGDNRESRQQYRRETILIGLVQSLLWQMEWHHKNGSFEAWGFEHCQEKLQKEFGEPAKTAGEQISAEFAEWQGPVAGSNPKGWSSIET